MIEKLSNINKTLAKKTENWYTFLTKFPFLFLSFNFSFLYDNSLFVFREKVTQALNLFKKFNWIIKIFVGSIDPSNFSIWLNQAPPLCPYNYTPLILPQNDSVFCFFFSRFSFFQLNQIKNQFEVNLFFLFFIIQCPSLSVTPHVQQQQQQSRRNNFSFELLINSHTSMLLMFFMNFINS